MNRAVPSDFSYERSDSSGTSIPAEPAERVASENVCPISKFVTLSRMKRRFRRLPLHCGLGFAVSHRGYLK